MVSARRLVPRDMVKLGEAHPRLGGSRDFHRRGPYSLRRSTASLTRPGFRIDEPGLYVSAKLKRRTLRRRATPQLRTIQPWR
jgi:hypothetical protein